MLTKKLSLQIGRWHGAPIYLHYSVFILVFLSQIGMPIATMHWRLLLFALFYASILVHEMSHGFMLRQVGNEVDHIEVFFLGGYCMPKSPDWNPQEMFAVSIAGPIASLLCFIVVVLTWMVGTLILPEELCDPFTTWIYPLAFVNALLASFNMLPVHPLDGGRIFYAIFWWIKNERVAQKLSSVTGVIGGIVFLATSVTWYTNWILGFIGCTTILLGINSWNYDPTRDV